MNHVTIGNTMRSTDDVLTARQLETFFAIRRFADEHGYLPSIRELMPLLGIGSTGGMTSFLKSLIQKGLLSPRDKAHQARSLSPLYHFIPAEKLPCEPVHSAKERELPDDSLAARTAEPSSSAT